MEEEINVNTNESRRKNKPIKRELIEWAVAIVSALLLAFLINMFVFKIVTVNKTSMVPTLQNGDKVFLNKIVYMFGDPKSGDIVVFQVQDDIYYVKRVIGLPGDKIDITDGKVYLNDIELDEPYLVVATEAEIHQTVPEDSYFVMGDNRNVSYDSKSMGCIARSKIEGRVDFKLFPFENIEKYNHDYAHVS